MRFNTKFAKVALVAGLALSFVQSAAAEVDLQFYFPVAVGGEAAKTIDGLTCLLYTSPSPRDRS